MATGYETRNPGRNTFASQGPQVEQIGGRVAPGEHRGAQLQGGEASGQGRSNGENITQPGLMAGDLGEFFGKAVEPYLQRVQQQKFFEGMARAQAGESIEELSKSHNSLVGRLFGPTSFEEGAQTFTAIKAVDSWQAKITDHMDDWVKMTPEEQGKALSEHSMAMMGDDPYVNQIVQKEIITRSGPLLDTINKARFKWQQQQFHDSHYAMLESGADNLQALAAKAAQVNDPADKSGMESVETAVENLAGLFPKPDDMSDDTYRDTITDFLSGSAQRGNFYAYNALVSRGALQAIGSDKADKVLAAYDRWSKVGLAQAKGQHVQEVLALHSQAKQRKLTALQYVAGLDAINAKITQETGIRERAFDSEKLVAAGDDIIDMIATDMRRDEERQYQAGVRAEERKLDKADEEADAALKAQNARNAWATGTVNTFASQGGDTTAINVTAMELYNRRDWGTLSKSYNLGTTINKPIQNMLQAKIVSAHGSAYTGEVKEAYGVWQEWSKKDMAAAIGYFGNQAARLLTMDRMVASGEPPSQAYLFAFAETDIGKYSPVGLTGHEMSEAKAHVEAAVDSKDSGWFGRTFGGAADAMSPSSRELVINETFREVGVLKRSGSHLPPEVLADAAVKKAFANGHMEFHGGGMAWVNPPNASRLPAIVKMNPETFRNTLKSVVDKRLKASGVAGGYTSDYDINRVGDNLLIWTGDGKIIKITPQDISSERKAAIGNRPTTGRVMPGVGIPL